MALSSKITKGIEIEIGGNSTKLKTALDTANRSIRTTQSELKTLQNNLKLEWNADNFKRAQELSQRALEQTRLKAEALRKALTQLEQQGEGSGTERYEAIRRELSYVEVAAQKAERQLEELNNTQLDRLKEEIAAAGDRLSKIGTGLTAGLTVPLAAAGVASVNYASDTEEALNKVEVAFGEAADGVKEWSDTTLNSYGLAKGTALDMAALFGDMATSMGFSREEAAEMSKTLVALAGDLASFKNIGIEQAQTALNAIFTGETESLKSLGVVMTQTNLEAYALAQGYKTAYTEMDQAQQVAVRYQYVLDRTANAQGDFARTSDSTANQIRILQESLKQAAATAGEELLPVITPIISKLAELVQAFGDLDEGTRQAVVQTGLFVAGLGPALTLTGNLTGAINAGISAYQTLKTAQTAATAAQTGLNVAMSANPIGAVVTAVGALVAVLGTFLATAALTSSAQETVNSKFKDTVSATEDAAASIAGDTAAKLANLSAVERLLPEIEALNSINGRTQEEQARLNALVDTANSLYPDLIGNVDSLTGSYDLNRTAIENNIEALRQQIQMEATRDIAAEKYRAAAELRLQLADANEELKQKELELQEQMYAWGNNPVADALSGRMNDNMDILREIVALQGTIDDMTAQIQQYEAEADAAIGATADLAGESGELAGAAQDAGEEIAGATSSMSDAAQRASALADGIESARSAYELLSKAQEETASTGYLTIDTVTELLERYPELSGLIVETADGYQLASGALDTYVAAQRAEHQTVLNEAKAAATALINQNSDEVVAIDASTEAIKRKIQALQAEARLNLNNRFAEIGATFGPNTGEGYMRQVINSDAAIQQYQALIHNASVALQELEAAEKRAATYDRVAASLQRESSSAGRTSSSSSGSRGSSADAGVEAFEAAMEELDYLRDLDRVSDEEYYAALEQNRDKYLAENSEKWREATVELYNWQKSQQQSSEQAYQEELADQQYYLDMGLISEEDYYAALERLRDEYLEANSDAWRSATVELYRWQEEQRQAALEAAQQAYEQSAAILQGRQEEELEQAADSYQRKLQALEEALDEEKAAQQEALEAKKQQIQEELDLEKERLNAVLEAIDEEIQARKELREDEDQDAAIAAARKRLEAAQAQLAYARTDEDRAEWEKEIVRLQEALADAIQEKEDTLFYREKEAEKEAVRDQIAAAEEKADAAEEAAEEAYQSALERLEAEYAQKQADAEAAYAAQVQRIREEYAKREQELQQQLEAQKQQINLEADRTSAAALAAEMAGLAGAVAAQVSSTVNSVTNNSRQANVTINQASSLTEGQIARTVEKVLNEMGR